MNFVKANNNKIERIQHRALSVVYQNYNSDIYYLLSIDKGVSFHIKFIFKLLKEIFKSIHKLNPSFLHEIFTVKTSGYDLRRGGFLLWDRLPKDVKKSATFDIFKGKLKLLPDKFCTCPICKLW